MQMITLRDYQVTISDEACKLLKWTNIVYLSMEVRCGKTLTAFATADKFGAGRVLFVTKKKAISSIQNDFNDLKHGFHLDIINYEQLKNVTTEYDLIIADEAHTLGAFPKPPERAIQLKEICEGKPVIFLSGSPSPESYSQLYHQFYISSFSPWKDYANFYKWAKDYVNVKKKKYHGGMEFSDYSNADQEKIGADTKHLFLSYTQEEAGFTQFIEEEVLLVRMQPSTYFLANKLISKRIFTGKNGEVVLADTPVKMQNKLHQIFSGTVILESEQARSIVFDKSKILFISEFFANKKIAIFYKFTAEGIMIKAHLDRLITEDPEMFNSNPEMVFISQIQSGREGTNLSSADAIVFINIDFSALSYLQARARLQTKDRTKTAKVYYVFSEKGIEQKILDRVREKKDYTLSYFKKDFIIATPIPEGMMVTNEIL